MRKREIINTHDQLQAAKSAGLPVVAIMTKRSQGGRDNWRDGWQVVVPGRDISEGQYQHWSDYLESRDGKTKSRLFSRHAFRGLGSTGREQDGYALKAAMEWCAPRFPEVTEWKRNTFGDYVDARVDKQFPLRRRERSKVPA